MLSAFRRWAARFLPWTVMAVVVAGVVVTGWLTNTTLRSVEKNLPTVLMDELNDLAMVQEHLAETAASTRLARAALGEGNLDQLRRQVDRLHDSVVRLRETYVFDNMVQASALHAALAPAVADVRVWLAEGISGYGPETETTLAVVQARIAGVYEKSKVLLPASREGARRILDIQRQRLDRFLFSVNLLFLATLAVAGFLVFLLIRQQRLRQREMANLRVLAHTRQSLRESEELSVRLLATIPDVVIRTDLQGTILFANDMTYEAGGYQPSEVIGRNMFEFIAAEDRQRAVENTQRMMAGPLGPKEYRLLVKDGSSRPFEVNGDVLRGGDGQPYGIVHVCRDITERQQLLAERQQLTDRLHRMEKMEALGTLAGGVAHDLNNVLGVLVGYSELLLMEIPEGSPLRRHVNNILTSGQRSAAIIQDLLTLARRGVAVSKVVNLNAVVGDILASIEFEKLSASFPRIVFTTELEAHLLPIKGSPVHLGKSLLNLLFNAVEAMAAEGRVVIRTENRHLDRPVAGYDAMIPGDYAMLSVEDTGHGIPEKDLRQIFEPFYTKKVMGRSGTGLGLAVVWGTVVDHGGYIDVHSEVGRGSRFLLYFPVTAEAEERVGAAAAPERMRGRGETLLVVDDVEGQRELARSMLGKLGYRVSVAAGGEEAVAWLQAGNRADLVVLDMIMDPGIDGLETFRRLRQVNPAQKAVIVSGFSETESIRTAQALGAGAYVRKPYLLDILGAAVRNELDRS